LPTIEELHKLFSLLASPATKKREVVAARRFEMGTTRKNQDSQIVIGLAACEEVEKIHPERANDVPWGMPALS
jgi:hypothetical protein